jgi:hypothetical protein
MKIFLIQHAIYVPISELSEVKEIHDLMMSSVIPLSGICGARAEDGVLRSSHHHSKDATKGNISVFA